MLDDVSVSSNLPRRPGLGLPRELRPGGPDPLDRARGGAIAAAGPLDVKQVLDFPSPSEAELRRLLDLTVAEARLARLLASGDTLEVVAQKLCIKLTTARSQLAAIFSKSGIRRQAKLVAILSRIAHLE
jgi:DNA-binding CsgD family transcriptional regulator